jgi:hypothetical protein
VARCKELCKGLDMESSSAALLSILRPALWAARAQPSQLVQAMAGFDGSGAADGLNAVALSADTSQQTFLTTPHT